MMKSFEPKLTLHIDVYTPVVYSGNEEQKPGSIFIKAVIITVTAIRGGDRGV